MDIEKMSDAMTGAEGVIETDLPQSAPRERIQSDAHRARWKGQLGNGDMTLEHAGEAVADLFARVADGDRPRDVGGSVGKLAARIDEIDAVRMDLPIVLRRRFIVGTSAIGCCRRDRRERTDRRREGQ